MEVLHAIPYFLLTRVIALIVAITTEFSSNSATATLFLPLLAKVAISIALHPLLFRIPATFTCYLKSADMLIPGLILKAVGIVILTILTPTLGKKLFPFF
jgi:sodium-dependent dicarboxylate transporter 2/3/5